MKRFVLPLFLGVFFLTLQTTLLASFPFQRIRPDMVLILILYLSLSYPMVSGGILAFFLGYLMDLFSGNAVGLFTFSRPFIFFVARLFKERFYLEGFLSQFLFALSLALFEGVLILILLNGLNPKSLGHLYSLWVTVLLPQSFFTGMVAPFFFSFFKKGFSLFTQHGVE
jgi:rod shape-determining protein MreD